MSILTSDDPNKIMNLIKKLVQFNIILSMISYLTGIAFLFYLIHEPMKTSFHDNSLLPGLANREFVDSESAERSLLDLKNATAGLPENSLPVQFLKQQFGKIGLEVYEHRFRFRYPFAYRKVQFDGVNLYAIFRAPRTSNTESIVISTPYRSHTNPQGSTLPSIALMLSLAKFFQTKNYWAKDIVFLISGNELIGTQAWLQAYQGLSHSIYLESDVLIAKTGVIQAALNLELQSLTPQFVQIKIEGLNGQLPNLDLFNVAVELCNYEAVPVVFYEDSFYMSDNEFSNWLRKARTMASMMITQATMLPTGAHGLFQKNAISSITLEVSNKKSKYMLANSLSLGRSIEGIVRSLNNMLEKFNRSFYFYLLASTRRFISISSYMIVFGLLALPLAFRSLHYYFKALSLSNKASDSNFKLWSSFKPCFLSHLFGILTIGTVSLTLTQLEQISANRMIKIIIGDLPVENLTYIILGTLALISLNPFGVTNRPTSMSQYCLQSMVALLNALLLFTSISLINISLALAYTFVYVPLLTIVPIQDHHHYYDGNVKKSFFNLIKRFFKFTALLAIHPIILHLFCLFLSSIWKDLDFRKSKQIHERALIEWILLIWEHLKGAISSQPKTLLNFIENWYFFDNWAFPLVALFVYPVWLQLWFQSITRIESIT